MRGRYMGWFAHMPWPQRLWWLWLRWLLPSSGWRYDRTAGIRRWAAEGWVNAYMAWKRNDYQPEMWP